MKQLNLALTILSLSFFNCSPSKKDVVVVYSPHGKELLGYFEQKFEKQNPTVDIRWLDMGAQTVFDRIRTEKENPQASLWWGGPIELFELAEKLELLESYVPTWSLQIDSKYKSLNNFWFATYVTPECIMYNNELITPESVPQDWDELLSDKWNNKIIIRDPTQSGTMRIIFSSLIAKEQKRTGSLDSGFKWLLNLHLNTKTYAADPSQLYLKLARGEASVTLWNLTDALLQSRQHHFPFGFQIPKSGTVVAIEGIALIKGAKQMEGAKKFYEFVTNEENAKIQLEQFYRLPVRRDIQSNADWQKSASYSLLEIDEKFASENQSVWMKYWQEHIRNQ